MTTKYPHRLTHRGFMQMATCLILRQSISVNHLMHWHEFYEITFVMDGYGSQILNGQQQALEPGTIFFLTPTDCHQVSPAPGSTLEIFNFLFTEELLTDDLRLLLFKDSLEYYTVLEGNQFKAVQDAYWALDNELSQKRPGQRLIIKGALEHIAVELVRSCQEKENNKLMNKGLPGLPYPAIQHPSIQRALTYIHNSYRKPLTLEEAAEQAQLTPNYFSECFRLVTGICFKDYLQSLRMKYAVAMLISSDLPVTDICYASGYNTLSHFTRAFKHKYGQSPTAYRHNRQLSEVQATSSPA